jgi:phosphoribosylanthranilate isomerase
MVRVKICGVTSVEAARGAVALGADAIGLNFHPASPRALDVATAREIVSALGAGVLTVGVFVDMPTERILALREQVGFRCVQLHGDEPPEALAPFLPHAYKALRVRGPDVLEEAARYPGEHILLDAYVPGQPGGTGATFDWRLARELASRRPLTLAGGLTPDNVARAVTEVRPFCVDVASGVERAPGVKDLELVRRFIEAARSVPA